MNDTIETFQAELLTCTKCALAATRHHVILGEGPYNAPIFIIGEAPGYEEDLHGRPFIGPSGQLLDKMLDACGFNRQEHVFISNIVRCRPPGNRPPTPQEAAICLPWLQTQIELVNPKILILLGSTALRYMAGPGYRISQTRGTWRTCQNRLTMPIYHPSALLRNPALKRLTWEDLKSIVYTYRQLVNPSHTSAYIP
ncbi:MAG: uracil-DNA glycosylase [Bacteroidales bacterium]|nr:uracil-DNA glycosylase [Bacteroidales bacterium]